MTINFFGDFKVDHPENLLRGERLVALMGSAHHNVTNFEAPVKDDKCRPISKSGPSIYQPVESAQRMKEWGCDIVSLANNHALDYGQRGMQLTLDALDGVNTIGGGNSEQAFRMHIMDDDGLRVGIMALTQREFGVHDEIASHNMLIGTAGMSAHDIHNHIVCCRQRVDCLVLYIHAGIEEVEQPLPELRQLYRQFLTAGADAIIASHPHAPQGWEMVDGKPIFYSLGNFCFEKRLPVRNLWQQSLVVTLVIDKLQGVVFTTHLCRYDIAHQCVELCDDDVAFRHHIERINDVLQSPDEYMETVNAYCDRLLPFYDWTVEAYGLRRFHPVAELKRFIKRILHRNPGNTPNHLVNTLQCEVHRWAYLRGLRRLLSED